MKEIDYVKIFKALSDEMRLKILQEIAKHEEICVCKLNKNVQIKFVYGIQIAKKNLIKVKPQGKWNFYSINSSLLTEVFSQKAIKFFQHE
jgi:ArsR family transcriptional regulator